MQIGIIGAGISGLSAALRLSKAGHEVEVFERSPGLGGLIGTFDLDGLDIEHYYHFLCAQDTGYFGLCAELGLEDRIRFVKARTGFYYEGKRYPFSTPLDLLRFDPIPLSQRIRFGLFALEARLRQEWAQLDELTARPWLIDRIGQRAYEVIWEPLLALKFGRYHDSISAAWVWHRLHRVAKSKGRMGYLEGGTALLIEALGKRLEAQGVRIHLDCPVERIVAEGGRVTGVECGGGPWPDGRDGQDGRDGSLGSAGSVGSGGTGGTGGGFCACERVISTVPLTVLAGLLPVGWDAYATQLRRIQYIGVVCLCFKLRRPISGCFWLNIHDHRVPFNGIIEYTNLNALGGQHGHIVYVPYYVATDHPFYAMDDDAIFQQSWSALKAITPGLSDADLVAHHVARSAYAQAICPTGFLKILPGQAAPITGLHLLDSTFLYPEDRTQSGHVRKAWECCAALTGAAGPVP